MTNGEKYKKAFSVLQTSKGSLQEVENMAKLQRRIKMKTAAAVIAGCIILGGTGTAYADFMGESLTEGFDYEVSGNNLTMVMDGETTVVTFTIEGKNMTMELNGEEFDMGENKIKIHLQKK